MWTLDKFFNPDHTGAVFSNFYGIENVPANAFTVLACLQLLVVLAFVSGSFRRLSYGLTLIMHGISTLSSWRQYLAPFDHLLFFAAWPMLAACLTLYWLRGEDNLLSIDGWRNMNKKHQKETTSV